MSPVQGSSGQAGELGTVQRPGSCAQDRARPRLWARIRRSEPYIPFVFDLDMEISRKTTFFGQNFFWIGYCPNPDCNPVTSVTRPIHEIRPFPFVWFIPFTDFTPSASAEFEDYYKKFSNSNPSVRPHAGILVMI